MQEIRSSNPPVVTGICDPNKFRARHHLSFKVHIIAKFQKIELYKYASSGVGTFNRPSFHLIPFILDQNCRNSC